MLVVICSELVSANPPIASSFDDGAEGWTIADLNCSNYAQIVGGGSIAWLATGGAPSGFIRSTDPTGNCYSFESPPIFEGDRSSYTGGSLRWWIRTNANDWPPGSLLILVGGGLVLVADVPHPTTGAWLRYEVPLAASEFHVSTASGPIATQAQFDALLANLASIRISAEFASEAGEETVDLDSVVLRGSCLADLNGDGVVDATDLAILLGAWGSGAPAADLDGDAAVNASDLAILLGAWGPCP